jgi:Protein of unknown function (DUF732)
MDRKRTAIIAAGVLAGCLVVGLVIWALAGGGGSAPRAGGPAGTGGTRGTGGPVATAPGATRATNGATSGPVPGATGGSTAPGTVAGGPLPGGEAAAGFLNELGAIDPALVRDPAKALRAGQATCTDLQAHKPREALIRDTVQRFKTPDAAVTESTASLIVDVARNNLCPD